MKMKDIKVGEEYACGPPNSRHESDIRRVRVVALGVYGEVSGPSGWQRYRSQHPTFVEVEAVGKDRLQGWPCRILTEDFRLNSYAYGKAGDLWINNTTEGVPVRDAYRYPANHIQRPWAEEEERRKIREAHNREAKQEEGARRERLERAVEKVNAVLPGLGLYTFGEEVSMRLMQMEHLAHFVTSHADCEENES